LCKILHIRREGAVIIGGIHIDSVTRILQQIWRVFFLWFSDEMYAAIEETGQVYMSGSETYAQIQPLAVLDITSEANSDGSHYPPQPPSVDSLKHVAQVHSRQGQ